ncbi:MAG: hypothetical protein GY698_09950 [Actinomycetia bacterium]|nr:hypothetical protein [Actinomycetes bacterium]
MRSAPQVLPAHTPDLRPLGLDAPSGPRVFWGCRPQIIQKLHALREDFGVHHVVSRDPDDLGVSARSRRPMTPEDGTYRALDNAPQSTAPGSSARSQTSRCVGVTGAEPA